MITAPRGTQDILPADIHKWQTVERAAIETAALYGFTEIRFPTFESTELFVRGVGDTTDVVTKEMYTFTDKGDRSVTLRPEGTASTVRAAIEHGLLRDALPLKVCYVANNFRYEKPQAGRFREFHQFGIECFGPAEPSADAEMMLVALALFKRLGVSQLRLEINSIGCPHCRPAYHKALKDYFEQYRDTLCPTCQERLDKNPMRIIDCKSPVCKEIAAGAPKTLDHLCPECEAHFKGLQDYLTAAGVEFVVNPTIVRGLDYYTRTVFELVSTQLGSQGTVCGGGRYDGLVTELGGPDTPALGFGMGIERLIAVMEANGLPFEDPRVPDLYLTAMGETANRKALAIAEKLRDEGFSVICEQMGRSVKASMKYAGKSGCRFACVLGDNELENNRVVLKDMQKGESLETSPDEISAVLYEAMRQDIADSL